MPVPAELVSADGLVGHNLRLDQRLNRNLLAGVNNRVTSSPPRSDMPTTVVLLPLEPEALPEKGPPISVSSISTLSPSPPSGVVAAARGDVFPDFVAHAPRPLVGDADLALDPLGGKAVPDRGEQEHDVEPVKSR